MDEKLKYSIPEMIAVIKNTLKQGEENAIKKKTLLEIFGQKDDRNLRIAIFRMRQDIKTYDPILSSEKGYWYAKSLAEYQEWYDYQYSYIQSISHNVRLVGENVAEKFGGQVKMNL